MAIPLQQQFSIARYIVTQKIKGVKRYPLVLMLEPLFRCNLACAGCGKIDYPDEILQQRMSVQECLEAVDECGAPVVSIPGGEPLLHKDIGDIVRGIVERRKFVYLCTNALLLEKKLHLFEPSPYLAFSIHLDGDREIHDDAVCQDGVYDRVIKAIQAAQERSFRVNVNCTLFDGVDAERTARFFDTMTAMGIDGITVSPGYAYERAPDQEHFLQRQKTRTLFRSLFRHGAHGSTHGNIRGKKPWPLSHSSLYLDFLAGNQTYHCTPWGNPTRNIFGWQRPCYLLGEGYCSSFKELMEETDWTLYGTGQYEKCANCMAHCGYEASAVEDSFARPLNALKVAMRTWPKTTGPMAKDIDISKQRTARYVFDGHVQKMLDDIRSDIEQDSRAPTPSPSKQTALNNTHQR
ncbi:MAG: adenosyl-hopene transferase HpnH [Alphaproteobacteria bacterium GM7ARS4]|nr:adenosyl-hopene transferase HpnH [Alphaproteobacteria bacterium GM7ARS4]